MSRLGELASQMRVRNLSIGDQTSVMGYMRVLTYHDQFQRGDMLIWEYSLLDHLLTLGIFDGDEVIAARRLAWNMLLDLGVRLVLLLTPPRDHLARRTTMERIASDDAAELGIPVLDLREIFSQLRISSPEAHYRDDRHPRIDSPVVTETARRLARLAAEVSDRNVGERLPGTRHWRWVGARELASAAGRDTTQVKNTLVEVDALRLQADDQVALPADVRVIAMGVVSSHGSGAAWCGHLGCPPASTRLPEDLNYSFLLRVSALPCLRGQFERIAAAPDWAFRNGVWRDYGQRLSAESGPVLLFGVLVEDAAAGAARPFARFGRWSRLRQRLGSLKRRLLG